MSRLHEHNAVIATHAASRSFSTPTVCGTDRRFLKSRRIFPIVDENALGGPVVELVASLDEEETRATREGLSEDELALFDLLKKDKLDKSTREKVKQASKALLASVRERLAKLDRFWEKEQTKADVEVFILDQIFASLPTPPFASEEKTALAKDVYTYVWQRAVRGDFAEAA